MNIIIKLMVAIFIISFAPFVAFSNSNDDMNIQIIIRSDKETYRLGEPIDLFVDVINKSNKKIILKKHWYPNNDSLQIIDDNGNQIKYLIEWDVNPPSKDSFIALDVKGVWHDKLRILNSDLKIVKPGKYQIKIKYENHYKEYYSKIFPFNKLGDIDAWTGCIFSNSIEVNIIE